MLAGRPPFTGNDDFQVLYQQVHEPPPPLRELAPDVPVELERVLNRSLAKSPTGRYETMAELSDALEAALPNAMPRIAEQASPRRSQTGPRTNPLATFAVLASAVVVIGFAGGYVASRIGRRGAATGRTALFVLSEPPGALVELYGKALPQTTPTMAPDIAPGSHTVRIQRVGTAPVVQTVRVGAGERASVQVNLTPVTHRIEVHSVPEGASVYLDNRLILGETPTHFEVTDDDFHDLRVEKAGYEPKTRSLTPDDKAGNLTVTLTPESHPRGWLMVDGNTAAEVWIDGVNTGYTTPTLGLEVAAGTHVVELRDSAGHRSQPTKVTVGQGQTKRLLLAPSMSADTAAAPQ
jgi:hypothetical protein